MYCISERKAKNVKKLFAEHEILTFPNSKIGQALTPESKTLVKTLYKFDDIRRMMPEMKDFLSIKNDDRTCFYVFDINELYDQFKSEYKGLKISIFKFTKLRPCHCVLAGSRCTHNVFVY